MASQVVSAESLRAKWEQHLDINSTSSTPPRIPPSLPQSAFISLNLEREKISEAWEKTKKSDFFVNAAFPFSVVQSINDQITAASGAVEMWKRWQLSRTRRALDGGLRSWRIRGYADFVVDILMTRHLGPPSALFSQGWLSIYCASEFLDHHQCELRCLVLRDVVAHANGIKTYNTYPKEWYQPWSEAALPPLPSTMADNSDQIVGEKRKNLEDSINSTAESPKRKHPRRKYPRVSTTSTANHAVMNLDEEKTSKIQHVSIQATEAPLAKATTSGAREHSIIQELKLKSANLLSSIGPRPTDQDLEAKLTPLDIDTNAENWQAQLTAKATHNKMETRIHQLLKDQHTEKARLVEGLTDLFIEGITNLVEIQQEQRLEAAAGKEKDAEYWLSLLNSATTSRGTGNSE